MKGENFMNKSFFYVTFFSIACSNPTTEDDGVNNVPDSGSIISTYDADVNSIVDAMVEPITEPDAMVEPDPVVCSTIELLENGNLDGTSFWYEYSSLSYPIVIDMGTEAYSFPNSAFMGGEENLTELLAHEIYMPTGATDILVSGKLWLLSLETETVEYDSSCFYFGTSLGENFDESAGCMYNTSEPQGEWTSFQSPINLLVENGGWTYLQIISLNDDLYPTMFIYDDISVTATICE